MAFIFALLVSVALVTLFVGSLRRDGAWTNLWVFFLIVFLGTWSVGLWAQPVGPVLLGIAWLPALFGGVVLTLILAASIPETVSGGASGPVRSPGGQPPSGRPDRPEREARGGSYAEPDEKTVAPTRADETSASSRLTSDDVLREERREERAVNGLLFVLLALLAGAVVLGLQYGMR